MQLRISAPPGLDVPPDLRRAIDRRLRLAWGRHAARLSMVHVQLDADGLEGDDAIRCRLRIRPLRGAAVRVEERGPDPLTAALRAGWRLGHRLERGLALAPIRASRPVSMRSSP